MKTLSKRGGSRDVMTRKNMMTLFNLLKRLIDEAKFVIVGSPFSIITLLKIKKEYQRLSKSNPMQFDNICVSRCPFLFNNYTDIFNKVKKDEIDLNVLFQLLHILKQIEDGKLDQHTGSYEVGKLLKSIYIDSAIKKADNINKAHDHSHGNGNKDHSKPPVVKKISWSEFKAKNPVPNTTPSSTA